MLGPSRGSRPSSRLLGGRGLGWSSIFDGAGFTCAGRPCYCTAMLSSLAVRDVGLEVWKAASRNADPRRALGRIAAIVSAHVPLDRARLYELDFESRAVVSLVGWNDNDETDSPVTPQGPLGRRAIRALRSWMREGAAFGGDDERGAAVISALLGGPVDARWFALPLSGEDGSAAALILRSKQSMGFEPEHLGLLETLREPFTALIENNRRLVELDARRRAAEADKRTALTKLGREELTDTIIGLSGGLSPVMSRVDLVAGSDIPVLLIGETGSGKELIARAIHNRSRRAGGPFIRVNCGAIPSELVDSQLFGHERGAFTGATSTARGWFERADEGTLLLDEVAELPLAAQVRLLRVLQDGSLERVGGERPIEVDVRIVAATHRDLPAMVQAGRFREDLWYRIFSFPILLPPLRERQEDLPALAEHLAQRAARRFGLRYCAPSPQDLNLLAGYSWPGNIRELASVIDRAAILGDGERLAIAESLGTSTERSAYREGTFMNESSELSRIEPLDAAMRVHIERALTATRGKIEGRDGAASILQINPHTLRARMRKLGIDWTAFRKSEGPRQGFDGVS